MTEDVQNIVPMIFWDHPDWYRISAYLHIDNQASEKVLQRTGFTHEGVLCSFRQWPNLEVDRPQDVVIYSFVRKDLPTRY